MRTQTLWFICLIAFAISLYGNFWYYCADTKSTRPFWTVIIDIVVCFLLLSAIFYTISSLTGFDIYAGHCDKCGNHNTFAYHNWCDEIKIFKCRYCNTLLWYI